MGEKDLSFLFPSGRSFGEWLRAQRESHGYTVSSLSQRTGVDIGTISRLENNLTQCTLMTAVRLGEVLKFSWVELRQELNKASDATITGSVEQFDESASRKQVEDGVDLHKSDQVKVNADILKAEDVRQFIRYFEHNPDKAQAFLNKTLNIVLNWEAFLGRSEKEAQEHIPENVHLWIKTGVLRVEVQYPIGINSDIILKTFERGGAVIPKDVEVILRAPHFDIPSLGETASEAMVLLRRLQGAAVERAKLQDVLRVDSLLKQEGKFLMRYWSACQLVSRGMEFDNKRYGLPGHEVEEADYRGQFVLHLVSLYRWLQYLDEFGYTSVGWLHVLRVLTSDSSVTGSPSQQG